MRGHRHVCSSPLWSLGLNVHQQSKKHSIYVASLQVDVEEVVHVLGGDVVHGNVSQCVEHGAELIHEDLKVPAVALPEDNESGHLSSYYVTDEVRPLRSYPHTQEGMARPNERRIMDLITCGVEDALLIGHAVHD